MKQKALLKEYAILGHFYNVTAGEEVIGNCRSVLEIVRRRDIPKDLNQLSKSVPDALYIMMNPGSCDTEEHPYEKLDLNNYKINFTNKYLVNCSIDNTLQRIMTLSFHKNWRHFRVINTSDIRFQKGEKFEDVVKRFEGKTKSSIHSIFHHQRHEELLNAIKGLVNQPVVLAMGVDNNLQDMVIRVLDEQGVQNCYGIKNLKGKYNHPLVREFSWVEQILEQMGQSEFSNNRSDEPIHINNLINRN